MFAKLDIDLIGKISNNALIVYAMMKHRGEYDDLIEAHTLHYKTETIAKMCNISLRTCRSCINELEEIGLLRHDRTGRASYYIVMPPEAVGVLQRALA